MANALVPGRIVHYVLPDGPSRGQVRPAIVVQMVDPLSFVCHMHVFTDPVKDGVIYKGGVAFKPSVRYSETKGEGTWHWPRKSSL